MSDNGLVFSIERCSMHDGPGIRTSVFLKGCPLRCKWCHNPESMLGKPQLAYFENSCIFCKRCESVCAYDANKFIDGNHYIDFKKCVGCGKCSLECPTAALRIYGEKMDVAQVMEIVEKDASYYQQSGGGITITGGEPLYQPEFSMALLQACHEKGIHTCMETSGFASESVVEKLAPHVDLFLFDYKETSPEKHKKFTGVDNRLILKNLDVLYNLKKKMILRCPVIPGYNDTPEHFSGISMMQKKYPDMIGIQIMPYHDMGKSKASSIGYDCTINEKTVDQDMKNEWKQQLEAYGVKILKE